MILGVGWVLFVLYAYPGVMTMDSFDQLREGREWFFTDAHPPIMAVIWGLIVYEVVRYADFRDSVRHETAREGSGSVSA